MITAKSRFGHLTVEAITFMLVLGALSMIWPAVIAVFLGVLLLIQWLSVEPEMAVLAWNEIGNLPMIFTSLRRRSSDDTLGISSSSGFMG